MITLLKKTAINIDRFRVVCYISNLYQIHKHPKMYRRSEQVFLFNSAYSAETDALLKHTGIVFTIH